MDMPRDGAQGGGRVQCRPIEPHDLPAVLDLLKEGFPRRSRAYWARGLERLNARTVPPDCPHYGFKIDAGGQIVGCVLFIVSEQTGTLRGNVSSWYVRPEFRFGAAMLSAAALRRKDVTVLNISPAPHTVPILEAQGFRALNKGLAITVPALAWGCSGQTVTRIGPADERYDLLVPEMPLLRRHAGWGCISLVCTDGDHHEPFVFVRRRIVRTVVPAAQLIWCRDRDAFVRYAGVLGRRLLRAGILAVACDGDEPLPGLPGTYRDGSGRKFYRGPHKPRLGDLADTELAIFGA